MCGYMYCTVLMFDGQILTNLTNLLHHQIFSVSIFYNNLSASTCNVIFMAHAKVHTDRVFHRDRPIMLIFSPIMLCCIAQKFDILCSILCSLYFIVPNFPCINYNLYKAFAIENQCFCNVTT